MLDLLEMLFSWNGILTLIIALYVIDDVFALGWKPKVRKMVGREDILNKDPDIVLLEQEVVRLEQMIVDVIRRGVPTGPMVTTVKSPFAERPEVKNFTSEGPHPLPNQTSGKSWTSWTEKGK